MNQIKETKYNALRIGSYLHVLILTQKLCAALRLGPLNTNRGELVSNSLRPSLVVGSKVCLEGGVIKLLDKIKT